MHDSEWTPPLPTSRAGRLRAGMASPGRGAQFLLRHPALIKYAIWPLILNGLITLLAFALLLATTTWLIGELHEWISGSTSTVARWVWWFVEIALAIGLIAICLAATLIISHLANGILCGYFYGKLAEQVEIALGGDPSRFSPLTFADEFKGTLFNLLCLFAGNSLVGMLNIIPVIGSLLAVLGTVYVTGLILGLDKLAHPLTLRGVRRWDQLAFARQHSWPLWGLGSTAFIGQVIPLIGAVLLVAGTVGGVLLYHRIVPAGPPVRTAADGAAPTAPAGTNRH